MSLDLLMQNVLNPVILFFFLGVLSIFLRTGLEIPQPIPKFISLYLLMSIGLHGGYELSKSGLDFYVFKVLGLALLMAIVVPIYSFFILRLKVDIYNAVAIAATYGSISAVTFITAVNFLQSIGDSYSGFMVAAMTLMESPAIIIGLILLNIFAKKSDNGNLDVKELLRESFFNPSVYILTGSLLIGFITGEKGWKVVDPLFGQLFKPMLAFFLLDMGIVAARRLSELKKVGMFLVAFAIIIPIINATIAILIASSVGMTKGDAFVFAVLCASASYIAVPAAMRLSVPEANPSIYVTMALALTFPFNISVGIPLYYWLANKILGG